ncbi:hypothetical protein Pla123a_30060 [Posidoniimonas polymericola]|uniref:Uncharacterized protein n=1 Tax=Posidoniimonas polymericola TaxID=2528002 RepID=A0A5C5YKW9_9BACT|nr:hypothetical protein [Posidoniimonas polymericola]TWT75497.1 hypothetical protein Pla123a_30060 [Posidoniimonas polymericola]
MRMYSFFTSMLIAGVMTTSGYGQSVVDNVGRDVSRGAQNLAGKAEITGDIAREGVRNTADAARRGVDSLRNGRVDANGNLGNRGRLNREDREDRGSNWDMDGQSRLNRSNANIDSRERDRASRDFDDADRNANWRFVERNGAWWYRTPMNTWMVQQDGRWVNYSGQNRMNRGYNDRQVVNGQYVDNGQPYGAQQAQYTDGQPAGGQHQQGQHQQAQYATTQQQGQPQGQHQEYMCIDGKRRLVTVISTLSTQAAQSNRDQQSQHGDQQDQSASQQNNGDQAQRYTAARPVTPPPAPTPGDFEDRNADLPEAPSRDAILGTSANSEQDAESGQADLNSNAQTDAAARASAEDSGQADADSAPKSDADQADIDADADANVDAAADGPAGSNADADIKASENTSANTMTEAPAVMDKE